MSKRRIYDSELHAFFITFSCYHRRRLLDHERAKNIVVERLAAELVKHDATCIGFVIMPDHVHSLVWFSEPNHLSNFVKHWKQRSSVELKKLYHTVLPHYAATIDLADPIWQRKYYPFNIYSGHKMREKLDYMHANPVRAGLVARPSDWAWSSARHYELNEPVGMPIRWVE